MPPGHVWRPWPVPETKVVCTQPFDFTRETMADIHEATAAPAPSPQQSAGSIEAAKALLNDGNTEEAADMFSRLLKLQCGRTWRTASVKRLLKCLRLQDG